MVAQEKAEVLQAFLGKLPEAIAVRLAKAIEVDRLSDGKALPHDIILEGLRPVLRGGFESKRTVTPLRMFCMPFEDLLYSRPRKEKQKGRIARNSILPVWSWLAEVLVPDATAAYVNGAKEAVLRHKPNSAMDCAVDYWLIAADAILQTLSTEAGRKAARKRLGDVATIEDAVEMAWLLAVGPEVLEIQEALPKPTPILEEDLLWQLREIYNRIVERVPDAGPFVAVIAMNRLERPWHALKLPLFVSRKTQETLIASTDMGLVGETIFGEIESHVSAIYGVRQPNFDPEVLSGHVAGFTELSMGIVKEVEMRRDGKWGQRLMKARADVSEAMDGIMARAPREIMGALPMKRGSYSGGARGPDISHMPDPDKRDRALAYAHLIVAVRPFAAAASFGAALKDAADEVLGFLRGYNEDILRELRADEGAHRENASAYFELAAELTGLVLSQEEGEYLRRRGRAALSSAAA